jgi:ribosomal protein L37E
MAAAYRERMVGEGNGRFSAASFRVCVGCGQQYESYHKARKYCSHECYANQEMNKYAPKKDSNHNELIKAMKEHCLVLDTSHVGRGFPDGLALAADGVFRFFDIKNPKTAYGKKGLNDRQKKWVAEFKHKIPVFLIYTVEEAVKLAKGDLDGLKFDHPGSEGAQVL